MLILQYCSDLHLEFPENKSFLEDNPIQPMGDLLVLCGDIVPFSEIHKFDSFFDELAKKFKQIYWIPGNHEYYHSTIDQRTGNFCEEIRKNVFLISLNQAPLTTGFMATITATYLLSISELLNF